MWKYILAWVPMVPIAIVNALFRETLLAKFLQELHAHQASTVTAVLLLGIYIRAITRLWKPDSLGEAFEIGLIWLVLTVSFEFLFGHYVMGHPWNRLWQDYNVFAGRLWVLVLIWIALGPYIFYRKPKAIE